MKLIVGLGNPGPKYSLTRHNVGFLAIDELVMTKLPASEQMKADSGLRKTDSEFKSQLTKVKWLNHDVILAKPQTFMNLSGEAVQKMMRYYNIELADLLVVHDEVDLAFGTLRYVIRRSGAGQNGVKNIHQMLGSDDYARLRLGVGRPTNPHIGVADHVLSNFNEPPSELKSFLDQAAKSIEYWVQFGTEKTANKYNSLKGK